MKNQGLAAAFAACLALSSNIGRAQETAAPKTESPAMARGLQDLGLPPMIYIENPALLDEPQINLDLYSLDDATVTPIGRMLYGILSTLPDPQVRKISKKKFYMLVLAINEYQERIGDLRYQANPDLLSAYRNRIDDVLNREIQGDDDLAGLGKEEKSFRDILKAREEVLDLVIAQREKSGKGDGNEVFFMKKIRREMNTLRIATDGAPLLPPTLVDIVRSIPEADMTQDQWRTLIESYPMGRSIWADRIDKLWRNNFDGHGVTIALIDVGVDKDHPFMGGQVSDGPNFTDDRYLDHNHVDAQGRDLFGKPDNRGGHGSHVASTILAYAPKAKIINIKALDSEAEEKIPPELKQDGTASVKAMTDALKTVYLRNLAIKTGKAKGDRVNIVSMSLDVEGANTAAFDDDAADEMSLWIKKLAEQNVLVVLAAGNNSSRKLSKPAQTPEAITIGAADYFNRVTAFSADQAIIDERKKSVYTKPDVWSYGQNVQAAKYDVAGAYSHAAGRNLSALMWGTSTAAPHTTGDLALLSQAAQERGITLTTEQALKILQETARPLANGNPYSRGGGGVVDPNAAIAYFLKNFPAQKQH